MKVPSRPRVFLDVEIDNHAVGTILIELFSDVCPKTCENFRCLCTGEKGTGKKTKCILHYKGVIFHKVVQDLMVQSGDISLGKGSGGESVYGGLFADESFELKHDKPFLLSMASCGKDTNGSQFFITTQPASHLDGVHVVFGRVLEGEAVVKQIEAQKTDLSVKPLNDCRIVNCGEILLGKKPKKKHKKRKMSFDSVDESTDSESEEKRKKKKKKRKKEKKRHKRTKRRGASKYSPIRRTNASAYDVPHVPSNKFLDRVDPREDDRSSEDQDYTPASNRSHGKPYTTRSGRKVKGRGALRYHTPSRSRSRSRNRKGGRHSSGRDHSGSDTPPHWRRAEKAQRLLDEARRKSLDKKDKWRQETSPKVKKRRGDRWESDGESDRRHSAERWSDEEFDEKRESPSRDKRLFGPISKPSVPHGTSSRRELQKKNRKKQSTKDMSQSQDITRSKWDTPERRSLSRSVDKDVVDVDELSKDSASGRIVSGVVGYDVLMASEKRKSRHKHKRKSKTIETTIAASDARLGNKKQSNNLGSSRKSIYDRSPPNNGFKRSTSRGTSVSTWRTDLSSVATDSSDGSRSKRQPGYRKRSRHRRYSSSSYSSRSSSDGYHRRRHKRPRKRTDEESFSSSHWSSSSSWSKHTSSMEDSGSVGLEYLSSSARFRSLSDSISTDEDAVLPSSISMKTKLDSGSRISSAAGGKSKTSRKNSKSASKTPKQDSASSEKTPKKKKTKRQETQLSWQPPLEFGEEIEDEVVEETVEVVIKKEPSVQEQHIIDEDTVKDQAPAEDQPVASENGDKKAEDLDDIDALLSSALDLDEEPVKQPKRKENLKEKLMLLKQVAAEEKLKLEQNKSETSTTDQHKKPNASEVVAPQAVTDNTTSDESNLGGFGFLPKYEAPKPPSPPKVVIKKVKSPSPEKAKAVQDVGIWSDEETEKNKNNGIEEKAKNVESGNKKSPQSSQDGKTSATTTICTSENTVTTSDSKTEQSPPLPSAQLEIEKTKSPEQSVNLAGDEEDDSESEDDELLLHDPVKTSKKPFVFNIKLPQPEPVKKKKRRKKNKKPNKKDKIISENDSKPSTTQSSTSSSTSTVSTKTETTSIVSTSAVAITTSLPATSAAATTVTNDIVTNTTVSPYPRPNMQLPQRHPRMGNFNPYYPMRQPYMGPRGMMPPGQMYPPHFQPQYMGFPQRHPHMPVEIGFQPAPPEDGVPPPLPSENEPEKPPEPAYDTKRLSDQKVAAMFASQDITKENVEKFFDEDKKSSDVPSPASSRSNSVLRKLHKRKRRRYRSRHRYRSSSASSRGSSYSSRSRWSSSSRSSSYTPRRGRRRSRRSSYSDYSRSRSYSSDRSRYRRRSYRSKSSSYFSSSGSSRGRWRSSSSSGSDIDRPCRHYRSGRRRGRSRHSSRGSSYFSDRSRRSYKNRRSRSWSRGRSLSRSSFSSRYSRSD